ncbi:hypothetical protein LX15_005031 [Streptoalloteichus tenebrarius]|uniref:Uncharacterized protein n=1 Tax=Streptoalloteichus tenebrarius (strain ATCC 17920 / DSM 40477 / JCM 4838 / CBS 697.72 / NBRC 16177 / NCIMB 11028 / NRRL B-12390 / A12253. 1 / ISP 5477) TaxID=1933 RepID=A0ABT1I0M6_STRSD|nr:hypothetical protein [Streptoalloteichus tenebrarius]MCP2261310.1 hypothetical protein [Streptoalloteichus tenebrarius]BFF03708.1 hypothetical protein GCM10020241_53830 [Streptoalloteichus tenebrarius]
MVFLWCAAPGRFRHGDIAAADDMALLAVRLLRVGGILAVLTHCDWSSGELVDPTSAVVTAGQNAHLLYLQHVVVMHTWVRDGQMLLPLDLPAASPHVWVSQRDFEQGIRRPHQPVHSDVLVFARPP